MLDYSIDVLHYLAGFILVNLSASWRHNSSNLASDPPACATNCGLLSSTSALNLTTTSSLALRLVPGPLLPSDCLCNPCGQYPHHYKPAGPHVGPALNNF